jgi:AraC-like DNA-binding protein
MYMLEISNFSLLRLGGRYAQKHSWEHKGATQKYNFLVYIEEGECTFRINNNITKLTKNDLIFIPKNTYYYPNTNTGCKYIYLQFDAEMIKTEENKLFEKGYDYCEKIPKDIIRLIVPTVAKIDNNIKMHLTSVLTEMTKTSAGSKAKMNINFLRAMVKISESFQSRSIDSLAYEIEKYINENIQTKITLSGICNYFGYSKQYIIKTFKKTFDTTPTTFINNLRLTLSVERLTESNLSIKKIAFDCGFDDINYFSKQFKKKYGLPPREYRKKAQGI